MQAQGYQSPSQAFRGEQQSPSGPAGSTYQYSGGATSPIFPHGNILVTTPPASEGSTQPQSAPQPTQSSNPFAPNYAASNPFQEIQGQHLSNLIAGVQPTSSTTTPAQNVFSIAPEGRTTTILTSPAYLQEYKSPAQFREMISEATLYQYGYSRTSPMLATTPGEQAVSEVTAFYSGPPIDWERVKANLGPAVGYGVAGGLTFGLLGSSMLNKNTQGKLTVEQAAAMSQKGITSLEAAPDVHSRVLSGSPVAAGVEAGTAIATTLVAGYLIGKGISMLKPAAEGNVAQLKAANTRPVVSGELNMETGQINYRGTVVNAKDEVISLSGSMKNIPSYVEHQNLQLQPTLSDMPISVAWKLAEQRSLPVAGSIQAGSHVSMQGGQASLIYSTSVETEPGKSITLAIGDIYRAGPVKEIPSGKFYGGYGAVSSTEVELQKIPVLAKIVSEQPVNPTLIDLPGGKEVIQKSLIGSRTLTMTGEDIGIGREGTTFYLKMPADAMASGSAGGGSARPIFDLSAAAPVVMNQAGMGAAFSKASSWAAEAGAATAAGGYAAGRFTIRSETESSLYLHPDIQNQINSQLNSLGNLQLGSQTQTGGQSILSTQTGARSQLGSQSQIESQTNLGTQAQSSLQSQLSTQLQTQQQTQTQSQTQMQLQTQTQMGLQTRTGLNLELITPVIAPPISGGDFRGAMRKKMFEEDFVKSKGSKIKSRFLPTSDLLNIEATFVKVGKYSLAYGPKTERAFKHELSTKGVFATFPTAEQIISSKKFKGGFSL